MYTSTLVQLRSIAKEPVKMLGSLCGFRKYLTPATMFYVYNSQMRPNMEYCWHICAGVAQYSVSNHDSVEKRINGLVGDELFKNPTILFPHMQRLKPVTNISLLPLQIFKCDTFVIPSSSSRYSLNPPFHRHRGANHHNSVSSSVARRKLNTNCFPRPVNLSNKLPRDCFHDYYNIKLFKSRVNSYPSYMS